MIAVSQQIPRFETGDDHQGRDRALLSYAEYVITCFNKLHVQNRNESSSHCANAKKAQP